MSAPGWIGAAVILDQAFCLRFSQTLLHFLWQGAVVGVLVLVAGWCLRRAAARVRYAINLAAMLLMVACLPVTFLLIPASPTETPDSLAPVEPAAVAVAAPPRVSLLEPMPEFGLPPEEPFTAEPTAIEHEVAAVAPVEAGPTETGVAGSPLPAVASLATAAYLAGVVMMLARLGVVLWGGHRLKRCATPVEDRKSLALIAEQARRLGMRAAPAVAYCRRVAVPAVVGIVKPTILLPATLATGLAMDQLEAIFTHELAHIRRLDLLVNLLQRLVESLLFFHPAVWYVSRRVSIERENCCDDFVVSAGCQRLQYAGALIRMAELCGKRCDLEVAPQLAALMAAGDGPSQFKRRVMRLLDVEPPVRLTRGGTFVLLLLLAVLLAAPAAVQSWRNRAIAHGEVAAPSEEAQKETRAGPADESIAPLIEDEADQSEQSAEEEPALERAADLAPPVRVTAGGEPIDVDGFAAPFVGDFDEDGKNDLLVGQMGYGRLRIYRNRGTNARPEFDSFQWFIAGGQIAAVPVGCLVGFTPQLADFDGDGRTDIVTGSFGGVLYLFRRNDDGTFAPGEVLENKHGEVQIGRSFPSDQPIRYNATVFVHDWDRDGGGDLLLGKHRYSLAPNEGTRRQPVFGDALPLEFDGELISGGRVPPCVADWDGDGRDDLLGGYRRDIVWFRNTGTQARPRLQPPQVLITSDGWTDSSERVDDKPARPQAICVADLNGDGRPDLLLGDHFFFKRSLTEEQREQLAEAAAKASSIYSDCSELIRERPNNETRQERIERFRRALGKWQELEALPWTRGGPGGIEYERHGSVWLYQRIAAPAEKKQAVEAPPSATKTPDDHAQKAAPGVIDVRVVDSHGKRPPPLIVTLWEPLSSQEAGRRKYFDYPPWLHPSVVDDLRVWRDPGGPYWRHVGTCVRYEDLDSGERGTRPCEARFSMERPGRYRVMAHLLSASPAERDEQGGPVPPSPPRHYLFVDAKSEIISLELSEKASVTLVVPDSVPSRENTPPLKKVRVRVTGGDEKIPLEGLAVTAYDTNRLREDLIAESTTGADGVAVFQLPASRYKCRFRADRELPYVARYRIAYVEEEPGEQHIDVNLPEACELVFRAVDVDTGRGVPGVKFARENAGGEIWMYHFQPENLGAKPDPTGRAYETDIDGYYRCLVGFYTGFSYMMWSWPPGYESAGFQEVPLKTTPGTRIEHTFKLRRKVNADVKEGTGSAEPTPEAPAPVEPIDPQHRATAQQFLRHFKEGRIKEARRLMDGPYSGSELERIQASFHDRAGPFQEVLSYRNRKILDRTVLEARCRWERAVMLIRLLFNEEGEIDGFWLARDPQGPTPKGFRKGGYRLGGKELHRIARPFGVIEVEVVDSHGKPPPLIVTVWESHTADEAKSVEQIHDPPWLFPDKSFSEPWVWRDPKTARYWRRAGDYVGRGEWWGNERTGHPCQVSFTKYKAGEYLVMAHVVPRSPAERDKEGRPIDPRRPRYYLHVDAKSQVIPLELSRKASVRLVLPGDELSNRDSRTEQTDRQPGERMVRAIDGVDYAFRWCPPGQFKMGCREDDREEYGDDFTPQHRIQLTRGFWL